VSRVLFIAYYFPPLGGGGVQRSVKFVKHLPSYGYDPLVVTGPAETDGLWSPADPSLAGSLPRGTEVERIETPEPPESSRWRSRAERWVGLPRRFSDWWVEGVVETGASAGGEVDLVYASMSPFESATAAARLARRLGKPWVADLRDPWALDEVAVFPTAAHRRLELRRMNRSLASAAGVVMNTTEAARAALEALPSLASKPVVTIPNGYDEDDFERPAPDRPDTAFRIVHAGFAHTEPVAGRASRLLGGAVRGYDLMTRSHVHLLEAVDALVRRRPELRGRIEVHLAGQVTAAERERITAADHVRVHGFLGHADTIDLLRSADLLFLPMHDLPRGVRARTVPGKTYEYLASRRPILAAAPDGDARDLLATSGSAFLSRPDDVGRMAEIIADQVDRAGRGERAPEPDAQLLARFERRHLTGQLAEVFDAILGEKRAAAVPLALATSGDSA
jgi:glycosyltransferase involved in cell wall biosynthesis